jgi:hypothetical protein
MIELVKIGYKAFKRFILGKNEFIGAGRDKELN